MTETPGPIAADVGDRLGPTTTVGAVSLTVSDLGASRAFYEQVLGLRELDPGPSDGALVLGAPGGAPLVVLHGDRAPAARDPRATGLFHLAILLPSRADLAQSLRRVASARWPLSGASDHLVSEALYLSDPDGNGIELYRDRPTDDWPHDASGALEMATLALDLPDLAAAADGDSAAEPVPTATRMGHVHLQVAEIPSVDDFYTGLLGFDATVRTYPGALFVSAGGYHHHVGLNTWNSRGGRPPATGAIGLRHYEILLADADELARVTGRLADAGVPARPVPGDDGRPDGALVRDPSGNAALLRPR